MREIAAIKLSHSNHGYDQEIDELKRQLFESQQLNELSFEETEEKIKEMRDQHSFEKQTLTDQCKTLKEKLKEVEKELKIQAATNEDSD